MTKRQEANAHKQEPSQGHYSDVATEPNKSEGRGGEREKKKDKKREEETEERT
jgi:hypothetical protein